MKLGKVIGNVVMTKKVDGFYGEKFLVIEALDENLNPLNKRLVANDVCQAGVGDLVVYETGREGAYALPNPFNISDACILAIVDRIDKE